MARRNSTCGRTDYFPVLTNWYSTDYWVYRQVLSICRGDSRSVLSTGYCRNTQFGSVAVLLSEADSGDVLRTAQRRRGHGPFRGMELRPDGHPRLRNDRVRTLLVADHLVRQPLAQLLHRPDLNPYFLTALRTRSCDCDAVGLAFLGGRQLPSRAPSLRDPCPCARGRRRCRDVSSPR